MTSYTDKRDKRGEDAASENLTNGESTQAQCDKAVFIPQESPERSVETETSDTGSLALLCATKRSVARPSRNRKPSVTASAEAGFRVVSHIAAAASESCNSTRRTSR